jgi:hypothetical protein
MLVGGCNRSPTGPSSAEAVHDTLNATGSAALIDNVWSERSGGYDQQVFDDFVGPTTTTIRTVVWQGMRSTTSPPTGFYISFIADDGGFPLRRPDATNSRRPASLHASTFALVQANERPGVTQPCDNSPQQQCGAYAYSVTLTTPFSVTSGTRYWLLIQAESPLNALSAWSWRKGRRDNGFATSNIAGSTFPWDFAFALRP